MVSVGVADGGGGAERDARALHLTQRLHELLVGLEQGFDLALLRLDDLLFALAGVQLGVQFVLDGAETLDDRLDVILPLRALRLVPAEFFYLVSVN
jgi:hypothetical protein